MDVILIFDISEGYPAPLVGTHPIVPDVADADEVARATGRRVDVALRRGDPRAWLGIPRAAVTLASAQAVTPEIDDRLEGLSRIEPALRKEKDAATDSLLEVLLGIVTTPGVIDEGPLSPAQVAALQRLRDDVVPVLSVQAAGDLDDAVAAKTRQRALLDTVPARAARG